MIRLIYPDYHIPCFTNLQLKKTQILIVPYLRTRTSVNFTFWVSKGSLHLSSIRILAMKENRDETRELNSSAPDPDGA